MPVNKYFFILVIIINSGWAFGYNKSNHELITKHAIALLNCQVRYNFITDEEAKKIINGNVSEDRFGVKWLNRLFNQHFYNPVKPPKVRRRSQSIDVRFDRIAKRCFKRKGSRKFYFSVGEIVHHIQDCTNPAHVVPVYHAGPFKKDQFDDQDVSVYFKNSTIIDTGDLFFNSVNSSILGPIAIRTLTNINNQFIVTRTTDGKITEETIDWSYFWKDNPDSWFGEYGILGKSSQQCPDTDNYLAEKIWVGNTLYSIRKETYSEFSSNQIEMAVIRTAQFIYFAKTRLSGL